VPLASPLVVPPVAHGDGRDDHMEAFCYRKKKAQARRSSQGTGGTDSRGSERSSAGSETHEILMLLHRLAVSTSTEVVGTVTHSSALIGSAPTSQSYTLGPLTAPSSGTYSWYLDSGAVGTLKTRYLRVQVPGQDKRGGMQITRSRVSITSA
jgi:hypothetical protein